MHHLRYGMIVTLCAYFFACESPDTRDHLEIASLDQAIFALQSTQLSASDAVGSAEFGVSASLVGNTAVIGARFDTEAGSEAGAAYVYTRTGTSWSELQKLTGTDTAAGDQFGFSVGVGPAQDLIVIGSMKHDSAATDGGAVYLFTKSGTTWSQSQKLTASDAASADQFGFSLALESTELLVGSVLADTTKPNAGAAYLFAKSGTTWSQSHKFTASDPFDNDHFATTVELKGDTVLVGAVLDDDGAANNGSVYVFSRSGTTWSQQTKLTGSSPSIGARFGDGIALDGNTAIIGATLADSPLADAGAAYVFVRSGTTWSEQQRLVHSDAIAGDRFGASVDLLGNIVIVGSTFNDQQASNAGATYIFERSGTTWFQEQKFTGSAGSLDDEFGYAVSMTSTDVLVTARFDESSVSNSGAAYVFGFNHPSMTSPTPGSTFGGSAVTFSWSANGGTNVLEWWLYVGSSFLGVDILDSGSLGTSLSTVVSGIPTDSRAIFVRLWYRTASGWKALDYQYTASGAIAPPSMTAPISGSTFSGTTQTFTWASNGTFITEWWLYAGSSFGGAQYHSSGSLSAATLSRTVSTLPNNGSTVYVRLWYRGGGTWQFIDYQYTAINTTTPTITSPSPGSTLSGSTETFTWTDNGSGQIMWWLYVGTSVGANDLYDSGWLNSPAILSRTVSGLPTNGSTLHVRLWYRTAVTGWRSKDFSYTATTGP